MKKLFIKPIIFVTVLLLCIVLPLIVGQITSLFNYQEIDPNGVFAWISVHHIIQVIFFLIIILLINIIYPLNWRLGLGDKKKGINYVLKFIGIFSIYIIITFFIAVITNGFSKTSYPLTPKNVIFTLGFQLFLSGPSEEIIFRAFSITILSLYFKGKVGKVSNANLLAAIIFSLAHLSIFLNPFEITYNILQLVYAFILGLIYGHCYEKTNSVVYPMIIHSISNFMQIGVTQLLTYFMLFN